MINIENVEVFGWEAAIRGMRNPMNSWEKSDSFYCKDVSSCGTCIYDGGGDCRGNNRCSFQIGPNDYSLMKKLVSAGTDHSKFMRMIIVSCDILAPIYWVAEHDTYKIGTVRNSCSFMHKGLSKPFEINDFSIQNTQKEYLNGVIQQLNLLRDEFLKTKDNNIFESIRQILPQGYNVKYTWQANYQVLRNIYHSRKNHKLTEWKEFCNWIETLPYTKELLIN